ncbi:MAG: uroporphyrinogen-III C-methyltransferase [Pirellulales bacterium]|nr:uroporphyrinogen-III C-methyltransferase [Pirellulales bacterium]
MSLKPRSTAAMVYLVGAGPGDADLITLRGVECLQQADLVLYDYLVNPRVLKHAAPQAEIVCLGRHGGGRLWSQTEINRRMIAAAQEGRAVVRLKSGDPMIFGRAAEEVQALVAARVPFEIVPGVTTAVAISAYAGVPLTHRDIASAVAFVTGQEQDGKAASAIDYRALAAFPGTLVVYMGVTTAPHWCAALIAAGKPADTPVAIVRRCSWPDQQTIRCVLRDVAERLQLEKLRPPIAFVVGPVAAETSGIDWFTSRPLFGKTVIVTRADEQQNELRRLLEQQGAQVLSSPAIVIGAPADQAAVDDAIARLSSYDWLVFSSANGVRYFLERLILLGGDLRALGGARIAAIGSGTSEALMRYRLKSDLQPQDYRAEALAGALAPLVRDKHCLLLRASRGREVLSERLQEAGAHVDQVIVYQSRDANEPDASVAAALSGGDADYLTVTSSAIARAVVRQFGEALRRTRLVSISPITSDALRAVGYPPQLEAQTYNMRGMVEAILADAAASS